MGVITVENMMRFRDSDELYARVMKKLNTYVSMGLVDDGDFNHYLKDALEEIGQSVYKECEAAIPVCDYKAPLPVNFFRFHAGFKCRGEYRANKQINEQRPQVFFSDVDVNTNCSSDCCVECDGRNDPLNIIVRTYIDGNVDLCNYRDPVLLRISPNVRERCTEDSASLFCTSLEEITIKDDVILTGYTDADIYIQYFGLPMNSDGMLQIPDNTQFEKYLEYYIIVMVLEGLYLNSSAPDISQKLGYFKQQFDYHERQAVYFHKLPSFARMVESIRRSRNKNKFYNPQSDRTKIYR